MHHLYQPLRDEALPVAQHYELDGRWPEAIRLLTAVLDTDGPSASKAPFQVLLGGIIWKQGQVSKALQILNAIETMNQSILATRHYHVGEIEYIQHFMMRTLDSYEHSLASHQKALEVRETIDDTMGIIHSLSRIGVLYERQRDYETALDYFHRALHLAQEIDYKRGMTRPLTHIGAAYRRDGDLDIALEHFERALALSEEIGNAEGIMFGLANVGSALYSLHSDPDEAMPYYKRSLEIAEKADFKLAIVRALILFSDLYMDQNQINDARVCLRRVFEMCEPIGYQVWLELAQQRLAQL